MNSIKRFANSCKNIGIKASLVKSIIKFLGLSKQQEEIDTLYYFLNNFFKASESSPTSDEDLRIMQLCDATLLTILDRVFKKHGLDYWLDYGTLLGAARHKGFIPWDDDTDISMPREDYEKALEILPKELSKYGIIAEEDEDFPMTRMGVGYLHSKTGVWIDIYPVDGYQTRVPISDCIDDLKKKIRKYRDFYQKNRKKGVKFIIENKNKLIGGMSNIDVKTKILYHGQEFCHTKITVFERDRVYPLQKVLFEGHMFNVPAKINEYLIMLYGNNYMMFPRRGVEHHDLGRGPLKTWAKRNGVDMREVYSYLKEIKID